MTTEPPDGATVALRRATPDDGIGIGDVWLDSWRATFAFPPGHPDEDVRHWLTGTLVPSTESWVADRGGRIVAMMALSDSMVEQLYVAPDWIGRGVGQRLLALAKERRPDGLDLYCFAANARARAFYERHGFEAIAFGDGSGNEERQPDVRYRWRPRPDLVVPSRDGTPVAVFRSGTPGAPPLILVHGASADHTTFRALGPRLADRFDLYAIDRRGRGASGDTLPYHVEREFEDVAAVADAVAKERNVPRVHAFGHSFGGRCVLGAARISTTIDRVICYEGAPTPPGGRYWDDGLAERLSELAASVRLEDLLTIFLQRVVGMSPDDLARYRADPVWLRRVAAAGTIARELSAETSDAAGLGLLSTIDRPVLQLLGSESTASFAAATYALDAALPNGQVIVIPGARHAAHHTHVDDVVRAVTAFLAVGA